MDVPFNHDLQVAVRAKLLASAASFAGRSVGPPLIRAFWSSCVRFCATPFLALLNLARVRPWPRLAPAAYVGGGHRHRAWRWRCDLL